MHVEMVGELLGRHERQLGEEVADVLVGAVEPLGDGVDLGAVARREDDDLADVLARREVVEGLGQARAVDRHPLEQVERHGAVVQSDDDDGHACRRSFASRDPPSADQVQHSRIERRSPIEACSVRPLLGLDRGPLATSSASTSISSTRPSPSVELVAQPGGQTPGWRRRCDTVTSSDPCGRRPAA